MYYSAVPFLTHRANLKKNTATLYQNCGDSLPMDYKKDIFGILAADLNSRKDAAVKFTPPSINLKFYLGVF